MEELLYWIIEYIKVLLGYGFIMFIWPSVIFRKYLKGKSVTFRFGFCATVPIVIINTVVLMLGLLHILNKWTMWIFFYGLLIWSFREKYKITEDAKKKFKYLITGTFGWKHLLLVTWEGIVRFVKRCFKVFWKFYKVHWLEYTLLVVAVVYGVIYFSWGVWHEHSFGFSDIYVHHSWIYQLKQGKPFSAGIYPEGMHCFVYCMDALFGIRIYSGLLFVPSVNMVLILISIYCLMKELFRWRFSSIFSMCIFLTLDVAGRYIMIGMSRMQCALPQEFGFPAIFYCTLFLIRYLRGGKRTIWKGNESKGIWDDDLFIFVMSFAATIIVHFYATFMAFFLCLGVAIYYLRRIFTRERLVPLLVSVMVGLLIAAFPMVVGFVTGIPLQGSLGWGLNVIKGDSSSESAVENIQVQEGVKIEETNTVQQENIKVESGQNISQDKLSVEEQVSVLEGPKKQGLIAKITQKVKSICQILYEKSYGSIYGKENANILISLKVIIVIFSIVYLCGSWIAVKIVNKDRVNMSEVGGYLIIILASLIYMIFFTPRDLGLPMLVEKSRIGFISHLLIVMILVIPIDFIYSLLNRLGITKVLDVMSLVTVVGLIVYIYISGNYHSYLYFELTRFNATVEVTNEIIDSLPKDTYTILSPTDELYQVIEHGRHEEILTFMQRQNSEEYTIPTEYIFIFLEKKPFDYTQYHFFDGPEWLAWSHYKELYGSYSTCPEYITAEISEEEAKKEIMYFRKLSDSYTNLTSRTILESKLHVWCEKFKELYPNELQTYYEDDYFVCYYFRQNPQRLYNLVIE